MNKQRILVIGIDGATLDLVEPWAAEGHLPNLSRLMSQGCTGELASTLQPVTAPAWSTFMTGMDPGKHGLYDFIRRQQDSYNLEVTNSTMIAAPTVFESLSQSGHEVVAINVPLTYPPRPVRGVMVSGAFAPVLDRRAVYPPEFLETMKVLVPDYSIMVDYNPRLSDALSDYVARMLHSIEQRQRLATHLSSTRPWSLLMVVFMATDWAQHAFWHFHETGDARYGQVIRDIYRGVDSAIGALLETVDEDTHVLVMSDHGAGLLKRLVNLNRWLAEAGLLRFRTTASNPVGWIRKQGIKMVAARYRRYVPSGLRATIREGLGNERFNLLKGQMESALLSSAIDWPRTRIYALGAGGNLYVNLAGREPEGIVQPGAEYEQLRERVTADLLTLTCPDTGRQLIKQVHRREELYRGPFVERAPDLVIEWADYSYWGRGRYDIQGTLVFEEPKTLDFSALPLSGTHRPHGLLIAYGPGMRAGSRISGARLVDLAPTLLGLLGLKPPGEMDGRFLWDLLTEEQAAALKTQGLAATPDPTESGFDYSSAESEQISQHLRALGYL